MAEQSAKSANHVLGRGNEDINKVKADRLNNTGATASLLCAIHCAAMPLVITLLPLVGLGFLASEPVEWALVAMSAILGVWSLRLGYKEHGKRRALMLLAVGLTLLVTGRIAEAHHLGWWGVPLLVIGGCTVALSHVINGRLCRSCRLCADGTCHMQ